MPSLSAILLENNRSYRELMDSYCPVNFPTKRMTPEEASLIV